MTYNKLIKDIEKILKTTDRETQLKVFRALMRYQNIDGLDLEEALDQELDLDNTKEKPLNRTRPIRTAQGLKKRLKNVNCNFLYLG